MKISALFCLAFLPLTTLTSATSEKLLMPQIMTEQEMKQTGLDGASPEQRQAFERWAATWTKRVIEQAPSYRPGENLSLWIQKWPSYADPTKTEFKEEDFLNAQKANQKVDKVRNDGEIIELKDGSVWQISPFFRYLTTTWQRNHVVQIKKSENIRHPYSLYNVNLDQTAEANLKQPPSPTGKKNEENKETFKGSVSLQEVNLQGDTLTLVDGSSWKIAPLDIYRTRNWSPNDRIKIQRVDNSLYQYRLSNLDTGETALANQNL